MDTTTPLKLDLNDEMRCGDARMDHTHEEFVEIVNTLLAAPPERELAVFRALLDHTVEHFAQEERWMQATGFAAGNCHATQHASILDTMREVLRRAEAGQTEFIQRMAEALVEWFPMHASSMDAGLALHLQSVAFDSQTETLADPAAVVAESLHGCGSSGCH